MNYDQLRKLVPHVQIISYLVGEHYYGTIRANGEKTELENTLNMADAIALNITRNDPTFKYKPKQKSSAFLKRKDVIKEAHRVLADKGKILIICDSFSIVEPQEISVISDDSEVIKMVNDLNNMAQVYDELAYDYDSNTSDCEDIEVEWLNLIEQLIVKVKGGI